MLLGLGNAKNISFDLGSIEALSEISNFLASFPSPIYNLKGVKLPRGYKESSMSSARRSYLLGASSRATIVRTLSKVEFVRSSLNHDDVFILDIESKIYQFNGSKSSIQERAKALKVVQYINDPYHDGKCDIATIEDGKLTADAKSEDLWAIFGGFAPLPRKVVTDNTQSIDDLPTRLFG
ncbi:hypothetical protein AgCh_032698 [Apium graveolens]